MNSITEIKEYAKRNSIPIVMDMGGEFISDYILKNNCKKILEIGSAIGYSAIHFAELAGDIFVRTIEIDIDRYIRAVENIKSCGLEKRIEITNEDALFAKIEEKFDLIFIDAAKAQYEKFFEKFKANLSPNGAIITDNLFFHGMVEDPSLTHNYSTIKLVRKIRKFVSFLQLNPEFKTTIHNVGDGVSVSKRNGEYAKPEFIPLEKSDKPNIWQEIEYGHKVYQVLENKKNTGLFSYYKKEDYFVIGLVEFYDCTRIEITLKNMLMLARKNAIKENIHLIKIKLPENCRSEGINESALIPQGDGWYCHRL